MASKFVVTKSESGKFHFNLVAGNGEIAVSSQMYSTKGAAMNGIDAVRRAAVDAVVDDQTSAS